MSFSITREYLDISPVIIFQLSTRGVMRQPMTQLTSQVFDLQVGVNLIGTSTLLASTGPSRLTFLEHRPPSHSNSFTTSCH